MRSAGWLMMLVFPVWLQAQAGGKLCKWWVELKDKKDSPWSVDRPAEFLSARSLERRARNGVEVLEEDLPVNPQYVNALRKAGYVIHGTSRWMNAVAVIADTATGLQLATFPFVKKLTYLGRDIRVKNAPNRLDKRRTIFPQNREPEAKFGPLGYSAINLNPLQMPFLHDVGAKGAGIWVVVMDGGYINVDTMPFFDSIAYNGRLWPGPDFVERDRAVYESAQHGTSVLSVMASNLPGYFVGGAPDATYFLLKTEDTGGEFPIEEVNWIMGAEWADSIGANIINASLGYTSFSDTLLSHKYLELDGQTAIGSKGATKAARKGMIICNSAGNSGDEPWHYLGVPADAEGVVAVGALDSQTDRLAPFSSHGPTVDGRIKPDLSTPGMNVVTAGGVGDELTISAGTSIASPILVGSIAALWSDFPDVPAEDILNAVFATADQAGRPDNDRGYGMPDFFRSWKRLNGLMGITREGLFGFDYVTGKLTMLLFYEKPEDGAVFKVKNILGQTCVTGKIQVKGNTLKVIKAIGLAELKSGYYRLEINRQSFGFGM